MRRYQRIDGIPIYSIPFLAARKFKPVFCECRFILWSMNGRISSAHTCNVLQFVSERILQTICSASRKQMNILWGNFKSHSKPHKYFYAASNKEYLWEFNKFSSVVGKWRKDFINFPVCATSMPHIIHGLCRKELPTRLSSAGLICANIGVFLSNDNHWYSMSRSQICIHYVTKTPFGPFKELFEGPRDPLKAKKLTHPSKDIKKQQN